jgi:hypothetical protein
MMSRAFVKRWLSLSQRAGTATEVENHLDRLMSAFSSAGVPSLALSANRLLRKETGGQTSEKEFIKLGQDFFRMIRENDALVEYLAHSEESLKRIVGGVSGIYRQDSREMALIPPQDSSISDLPPYGSWRRFRKRFRSIAHLVPVEIIRSLVIPFFPLTMLLILLGSSGGWLFNRDKRAHYAGELKFILKMSEWPGMWKSLVSEMLLEPAREKLREELLERVQEGDPKAAEALVKRDIKGLLKGSSS